MPEKILRGLLAVVFFLFTICVPHYSISQIHEPKAVVFSSSDKEIDKAFQWASTMALSYKGDSMDKVGPWYEAALPSRDAFCMRDVSHQSIAAEILGMSRENENMFRWFSKSI